MAISKRLRYEILKRDGHRCFYCKDTERKLTVDHVVPKALGGTDDPTNLVASCGECNGGKSSSNPDAQLVAQVDTDALRWQMAWAAAVAEAKHDSQQRTKNIAKVKRNYTAAYKGRHGEAPYLPEGWQSSVGRWLDLGLTVELIDEAISAAVGRSNIPRNDRWAYFAGCCWGVIRNLGDHAKRIADLSVGAPEGASCDVTARAVIDAAVLVWREHWANAVGKEPDSSLDAEVREYASAIYPGEVTASRLIAAAETAGEVETTAICDFTDPGEYEEWDRDKIAETWRQYWRETAGEDPGAEAEQIFQRHLAAATTVGYAGLALGEAAFKAGSAKDPQLASYLETAADVVQRREEFAKRRETISAEATALWLHGFAQATSGDQPVKADIEEFTKHVKSWVGWSCEEYILDAARDAGYDRRYEIDYFMPKSDAQAKNGVPF